MAQTSFLYSARLLDGKGNDSAFSNTNRTAGLIREYLLRKKAVVTSDREADMERHLLLTENIRTVEGAASG